MKNFSSRLYIFSLILVLCLAISCGEQRDKAGVEKKAEDTVQVGQIPEVVMGALKTRFPEAEIQKWSKEKEDDIIVYDIEFEQSARKFEADIKEDGTIHNWEKAMEAADLPESVKKSIEEKYPDAEISEIMEITAVKGKDEELEGYEVVLETADKKEVEIMVAPDGKILEDSGEDKEEEK